MATSHVRLWKILRASGVSAILFGIFYLGMPPASSSAMVEAMQKVPPSEQFNVASDSLFYLMGMIGSIQILHGMIVVVCAVKGLRRTNASP